MLNWIKSFFYESVCINNVYNKFSFFLIYILHVHYILASMHMYVPNVAVKFDLLPAVTGNM